MNDGQPLVRVGIGQLAVANSPTILKATLGSCIGLAFLWPERGCYGMAHCLLPESPEHPAPHGARYVDQAITSLLRQMHVEPEHYARIEAHVAGGGNMMQRAQPSGRPPHIGQLNSNAAMRHLARHGIMVRSADVGGTQARQISLDCASACVSVIHVPTPSYND